MFKLFKCELLKYRAWTLLAFSAAFLVFLSAQYATGSEGVPPEPLRLYTIIGGIVLGLIQMGLHTRANNWTYLIHRPLSLRKIFTGLIGAGQSIIFIGLALPLLLATLWRDISTITGVDFREYGNIAFLYLLSTCFYLISCLVVLNKSKGTALLYLSFGILLLSYTPSSTLTQFVPPIALILVLLYLNYANFKADLSTYDKRPTAIILMSTFISFAITIALTLGVMAVYNVGIMITQDKTSAQSIPNTYAYFEQSGIPAERLSYALDTPSNSDTQYYVNQAELADHKFIEMYQLSFPFRGQINDSQKNISFADKATRIHWAFSHDSMLIEGYHQNTKSSAGRIGKQGFIADDELVQMADRFEDVPIILGDTFLQTQHTIYLINYEEQLLQVKHQVSDGERYINTPLQLKSDVLLMTNERVLLVGAQDFFAKDTSVTADYITPHPVNYRHIDGIDVYRFVDGYILLFQGKHLYGYNKPGVETFHAKLSGGLENIGSQAFTSYKHPAWYRQKQELVSPVLVYTLESLSHWIHPASMDNSSPEELRQRFISLSIYGHIFFLQMLSLLGGFIMCRLHKFGKKQTLTWLALTGIIGIPALLSFFLLNPWRPERTELSMIAGADGPDSNASTPKLTVRLVANIFVASIIFATGYDSARAGELSDAVAHSQSQQVPSLISRKAFLQKSQISSVELSPDGKSLVYRVSPNATFSNASRRKISQIWHADLTSGEHRLLLSSKYIGGLYWSTDSQYIFMQSQQGLSAIPREGASRPSFVINLDAEKEQYFYGINTHSPHEVLVSLRAKDKKSHGLYRVGINGELTEIYRSTNRVENILFDEDGQLSFFKVTKDASVEIISILDGKEKTLLTCPLSRLEDMCRLVNYQKSSNILYMQARFNDDLTSLYSVNIETGDPERIHTDPKNQVDLQSVGFHPESGLPILSTYRHDYVSNYGLDAAVTGDLKTIKTKIGSGNFTLSPSENFHHWLIQELDPIRVDRRYFIYDSQTKKLSRPLKQVAESLKKKSPLVSEASLSAHTPVHYTVSDGMKQHGYVTLPLGVDIGKAPLITYIHGGPHSRTRGTYDPRIQFLASRGYIVFQPNFRASTGFGRTYMKSANYDFGDGRVQQDIIDGIEYLLSRGLGDRAKLGVMGDSFGGFSALTALTFTPDMFAVGIAMKPPTDIGKAIAALKKNHATQRRTIDIQDLLINPNDPKALTRLYEKSPDYHFSKLTTPLYIWAGGRDQRVSIFDVKDYALRLRGAGKPVTLIAAKNEGHGFSNDLALEALFYLYEKAFAEHLGGAADMQQSTAVKRFFQRSTIIDTNNLFGCEVNCS